MMRDIYTRAKSVSIWLGEEVDNSNMAITFMKRVIPILERLGHTVTEKDLQDSGLPPTQQGKEWIAVSALFSRPWFGRMWILQEVVAESNATVTYGDRDILWDDLSVFADRIGSGNWWTYIFATNNLVSLDTCRNRLLILIEIVRKYITDRSVPVEGALSNVTYFEAYDSRDKIYVLQGLLPSGQTIEVDYSKEAPEVFREIVLSLFSARTHRGIFGCSPSLEMTMLSLCERSSSKLVLPSWVPDWTAPSKMRLSLFWKEAAYRAIRDTKASFSSGDNPKCISLAGKMCDAVQSTSSIACEAMARNVDLKWDWTSIDAKEKTLGLAIPLASWVVESNSIAVECERYPDDNSRETAFRRALLAMGPGGGAGTLRSESDNDFRSHY